MKLTTEQYKLALAWYEALMSGEFIQTKHTLWRDHGGVRGYCCLGVLCLTTGEKMAAATGGDYPEPTSMHGSPKALLHPIAVELYYKLQDSLRERQDQSLDPMSTSIGFTTMNDRDSMSFVQIAERIDDAMIDCEIVDSLTKEQLP